MVTYATFTKNAIGKNFCNPDGTWCGECVSFVRQYIEQVFGIKTAAIGDAKDYYNSAFMNKYFDKIPAGQEQNGDILCWKAGPVAGEFGHIGIRYSPGKVLSQNYNYKKYAAIDPFFQADYQGAMRIKKSIPKGGDDVIDRNDVTEMRAVMRDIKGWSAKNVDAGKYDKSEADAWVGKTYQEYITEGVKEGAAWRQKRDKALSAADTTDTLKQQVSQLQLSEKTLTSQNATLQAQAKSDAETLAANAKEIAELEKQLAEKSNTAVDEKAVVENWLARWWNSLFKKG